MLGIRYVREHPEEVKENIKRKFQDEKLSLVDELIKVDEEYRSVLSESQSYRTERNRVSEKINEAKKSGKDAQDLIRQAKEIPQKIRESEERLASLKTRRDELLLAIPNILHESVQSGKDDDHNVETARYGDPHVPDFPVKSHVELAEQLGIADFDASARVAGNGFFYLLGDLARLNQALISFGIQFMTEKGYTLVEPPLMTSFRVLSGTTPLHEIEEPAYKIQDEDAYLIATSEFPLIGMFIDQAVDHTKLPLRLCGYSQCFRKEIGSHGIDEKGLFRTHQFNKVEQIVICEPEDSWKYYDEILQNSIDIFKALGIPIRILDMCSGATSDLKMKQADVEAWSPRRKEYFEVCSCSNLGDNQARLLNIRVRHHDGNYYPHTLNDTAIATSRAMVAILENFQQEDGSVLIPGPLQQYMGKERIDPSEKIL